MKFILADAILGALAGCFGYLLGVLFERFLNKSTKTTKIVRTIITFGVLLAAVVFSRATGLSNKVANIISPLSPAEAFGEQLLGIPEVMERIKGKSGPEVRAITQQLTVSGTLKLEPSQFVTRARLMSEMLRAVDVPTCGRFAKGATTSEEIVAMINSLPQKAQVEWFALMKAAVEAEVKGKTASEVPEMAVIAEAMAKVGEQIPEQDRERFGASAASIGTLTDDEACWVARTLNDAVGKTPEPERSIAARALLIK